jgi:hypothetical protein
MHYEGERGRGPAVIIGIPPPKLAPFLSPSAAWRSYAVPSFFEGRWRLVTKLTKKIDSMQDPWRPASLQAVKPEFIPYPIGQSVMASSRMVSVNLRLILAEGALRALAPDTRRSALPRPSLALGTRSTAASIRNVWQPPSSCRPTAGRRVYLDARRCRFETCQLLCKQYR